MADTALTPAAPGIERVGGRSAGGVRRGSGSRRPGRSTITAYLFLAPFLLLFLGFVVTPAVWGIWISLHAWNPLLPFQRFVGLQNYANLLTPGSVTYGDFWQSMGATAIFTVASVPFLVVIPLLVAVLLNQRLRFGGLFRAIYFAPYVLGVAVIGVAWRYLLDPQNGVLNSLLAAFGLPTGAPWTVDVPWAWISLVGITVWWISGFNMVILLAGLKGINAELYDAAAVDGAGAPRMFWSVTLPGLRPVMAFVTTTTILSSANMFGQSYLLTQGAPGTTTRTAIMYIANQGLSQNQMGAASAMSYVLFAFLAIVSIINFRLQSRAE